MDEEKRLKNRQRQARWRENDRVRRLNARYDKEHEEERIAEEVEKRMADLLHIRLFEDLRLLKSTVYADMAHRMIDQLKDDKRLLVTIQVGGKDVPAELWFCHRALRGALTMIVRPIREADMEDG